MISHSSFVSHACTNINTATTTLSAYNTTSITNNNNNNNSNTINASSQIGGGAYHRSDFRNRRSSSEPVSHQMVLTNPNITKLLALKQAHIYSGTSISSAPPSAAIGTNCYTSFTANITTTSTSTTATTTTTTSTNLNNNAASTTMITNTTTTTTNQTITCTNSATTNSTLTISTAHSSASGATNSTSPAQSIEDVENDDEATNFIVDCLQDISAIKVRKLNHNRKQPIPARILSYSLFS